MTIRQMLVMSICSANYTIVVTDRDTQRTWVAENRLEMLRKLEDAGIAGADFKWIDISPDQIRFFVRSEV